MFIGLIVHLSDWAVNVENLLTRLSSESEWLKKYCCGIIILTAIVDIFTTCLGKDICQFSWLR